MKKIVALILLVSLVMSLTGCTNGGSQEQDALAVSRAVYPERVPFPDQASYLKSNGELKYSYYNAYEAWQKDNWEKEELSVDDWDELNPFFTDSIRQFLSDSQGQNKVYSPLNVYMALGMLSEVTDGVSRSQVLALLGADSVEELRTQAGSIWNANYRNDGVTTSILASSLWLNENIKFNKSTLDSLAKYYYASSYQGTMGSEKVNNVLRDWLNEQTGGLLEGQTSNESLDADTIMALAATVNFHAKWKDEFRKGRTKEDVFHGINEDINCDFMYQDEEDIYYWGDKFSAVSKRLKNSGNMWFILPDEGVSVEELIENEQVMEFLLSDKSSWENKKYPKVHLAVPKFDVDSDMDLIPGLQALGVTDVFDSTVADFSPMMKNVDDIFPYVSKAKHAARVKIDEEGCTAVAYTIIAVSGEGAAAPPDEEVDFILDRPFIFVITGAGEIPLFVGVVNRPV